jgi:hypothetical protein
MENSSKKKKNRKKSWFVMQGHIATYAAARQMVWLPAEKGGHSTSHGKWEAGILGSVSLESEKKARYPPTL